MSDEPRPEPTDDEVLYPEWMERDHYTDKRERDDSYADE